MTDFADEDERLPYWAELWPSSLVLAGWLERQRASIAGQQCLDIGCGIGFTALVGQWLGAQVIGMDYEREALRFAHRNTVRNGFAVDSGPVWTVMDWRRPAMRPGSIDVAWGGDIMYEQRFATPLALFLQTVLRPGGVAYMAEPSRTVYDVFVAAVTGHGMGMSCIYRESVAAVVPQEMPVPVRVWRITR